MSLWQHMTAKMYDAIQSELHIAIICSGNPDSSGNILRKTFNPRGWKSYQSGAIDIAEALIQNGFSNVDVIEEGVNFRRDLEDKKIDLAWLNCAGLQGFDGICHAASALESLGIPYVGHRPSQSILLDNKYLFKMFAKSLGLATAPFMTWDARKTAASICKHPGFINIFRDYSGPFIVKPHSGRASNNISYVENKNELDRVILALNCQLENEVLVETYLPGREFCVAASGPLIYKKGKIRQSVEDWHRPFCFSRIERVFEHDEKIFTSMDITPISNSRIRVVDTSKEQSLSQNLDILTVAIYQAFSLTAMVRADMRQGADGKLYLLEVNPKPDLRKSVDGKGSIIALALEESGLSYEELIVNQLLVSLNLLGAYSSHSMKAITKRLRFESALRTG